MNTDYFRELYNRSSTPEMTATDRDECAILVVESESISRSHLRQTLITLGYSNVCDAPNHLAALKKLDERKVTHVIFEAKKTNMPPQEFLTKVLEGNSSIIALPTSHEPTVDDVFGLLTLGARGYLVKPFNSSSVEDSLGLATKGEPISEAILFAKDRNEALAALIASSLGNLAIILRQSQQFESAQREVPKKMRALKQAVEIGRLFSDGGDDALVEAIMEFCIERSSGPASRLGRIRKRLEGKKAERMAKIQAAVGPDSNKQQNENSPDILGVSQTTAPEL